jgi:hypothetical protein
MNNLLTYAKQANHPLFITVEIPGQKNKEFKLSLKRYKQMIKNYCSWYKTTTVCHSYTDYEDEVRLANKITFKAILY